MAFIRDLSIKTKLRWILAVSNVLVVVLLGTAMVKHDRANFRERLTWELQVINRIVASNCASSLIFEDQEFTSETLGNLAFLPSLRSAAIYRNDESLFAAWGDSTYQGPLNTAWIRPDSLQFIGDLVFVTHPVEWNNEKAGEMVLVYSLAEEQAHTNRMILVLGTLSLLAMLVSMLVSERLQRFISEPIVHLARAVKTVAAEQTYSMRVSGQGRDEVGQLVDAFNEMLDEVEKREQALIQASHAKSDFLANMSHELRTPLNGVIGMTSLLSEATLGEEERELVSFIETSADHLMKVINDILDFSKIEAGMMVIEKVPFALRRTMEEISIISGSLAKAKGLKLEMKVDPDIPDQVLGDVVRVRQVLLNLVSNAIKFTEYGGVTVSVRPASTREGNGAVRFSVRDSGIGIPAEKQALVFDHFTQADSSTTRSFGGTGLGLAICKQLVELMGGTIGVDSEMGQGAEFWFVLVMKEAGQEGAEPARQTPAQSSKLAAKKSSVNVQPAAGCRVLLAEDNLVNQVFARKMLEMMGAEVEVADNGEEAVRMVQESEFDLVFMDCQMPVMDGYRATAALRALGGRFADLPIIALTAFAMAEDRDECLAAGMDDYLTKPVDRAAVSAAIERWVNNTATV